MGKEGIGVEVGGRKGSMGKGSVRMGMGSVRIGKESMGVGKGNMVMGGMGKCPGYAGTGWFDVSSLEFTVGQCKLVSVLFNEGIAAQPK